MTAITTYAHNTNDFRLNWPRIGALSGSMSLHLYALILVLTPPLALQMLKHAEPEVPVFARVITEPPPEVVVVDPVPPPPTPVHRESHPRVIPHVAPVEQPVAPVSQVQTEMSIPTNTQATDIVSSSTSADVAPTALAYNTRTRVAYPRDSLMRGEHGTVVLRVLVGTDGLPQTVEIESSSGSRSLDIAARDAVRHWSFRPGTRDGVAHSAWARVPIAFDLSTL